MNLPARIAPIEMDAVGPEAAAVLSEARAAFGMVPNVYRVFAHSPVALQGYAALAATLEGGTLPVRTREQIALLAAATNGCDYCLAAHRVTGRMAGLSPDEIAAAEAGEASDAFEAATLAFAAAVLREVGDIPEDTFAAAQAAGLSDEHMVEVVAHLVANIFTNTMNRLARTPIDFGRVGRG
jgi:uncharacterized peroxidase-related enzyme